MTASPRSAGETAVAVPVPICVSDGQAKCSNVVCGHCGVACGLPTKPCGKVKTRSRGTPPAGVIGSLLAPNVGLNAKLVPASECPPARVLAVSVVNEVMVMAACAEEAATNR